MDVNNLFIYTPPPPEVFLALKEEKKYQAMVAEIEASTLKQAIPTSVAYIPNAFDKQIPSNVHGNVHGSVKQEKKTKKTFVKM